MKKKVSALLLGIASFGTGFFLGGKQLVKMINDYKMRMERNQLNMMAFNNWLDYIYAGGNLEQYFHNRGYREIIIYGNGYIGTRLMQALQGTDIKIAAVMDKENSSAANEMMINCDAEIPEADCIVITPVFYDREIRAVLQKRTEMPIISVNEIWQENRT